MKKLILLALVAFATATVWAAPDFPKPDFPTLDFPSTEVSAKLEQQTAKPEPAKKPVVHNKAVFDAIFRVHSKFEDQLQGDNEQVYDKPCSAVLIDKNWLLASLSCRGVGSKAKGYDHNGVGWEKTVAYRNIERVSIRANATNRYDYIWGRDIFVDEDAQIILLYVDRSNTSLKDEIDDNGTVTANLLIPQNPESVNKTISKAFINRERMCVAGRCSAEVEIKRYCSDKKCYEVAWKLIDGDAGDPLFITSKKNADAEYVIGFNNAVINGRATSSGRTYRTFDQQTLQAVKNVIQEKDPQAWKRISANVKDETNL